jgi:dienelactone hydrolase
MMGVKRGSTDPSRLWSNPSRRLRSAWIAVAVAAIWVGSPIRAAWAAAEGNGLSFLSSTTEEGVTERRFDLVVNGERVPAVLWTPAGAKGTRPLVLFGHGGSQDKRAANIVRMARELATECRYAALAIDGPGHGERVTPEQAEALRSDDAARRAAVRRIDTTAEWKAALDAVQKLPEVGQGPVGYWGVSMGTRLGVPLVAAEPRIKAAILGLFGLFPEGTAVKEGFGAAARSIHVPLIFVFQWNDRLMTRESGMQLYDAFGSSDKAMHINPGGHVDIPVSERDTWKPFWVRQFGVAELEQ